MTKANRNASAPALRWLRGSFALFSVILLSAAAAKAQPAPAQPAPAQPASDQPPAPTIDSAWNALLKGAVPAATVDQALTPTQVQAAPAPADDFANHFFYDTRTQYIRENVAFTGSPTTTGVINAVPGVDANPNGIPYPGAFQPSGNVLDSFMNFGTRGWLSDRVNTNFSFRYRQNLTSVTDGSPVMSLLNTFSSDRQIEMTSGYVEINGRATDGAFANTSLQFGRINVYGAELATMDGAAFTVNRRKYTYTLFAGRRYSYFSDPDQRAVGGGNFLLRLGGDSSLEYNALFYIRGTHNVTYRKRFSSRWLFSTSYRMIGSYPVDYNANAIWSPANGKTTIRLRFQQQLTNKDFTYDYTINARDTSPANPTVALYLGPISPHSDFLIDAGRTLNSRLRVGGTVWIRRLNTASDAGPFDTSFSDYHFVAQVYPYKKIELSVDYRQHNSDRSAAYNASDNNFFDVTIAGETRIQDAYAEVGRTFGEGRVSLRFGGFYRHMNYQDRFYVINNANARGLLGNATVKLDQRTRAFFDYSLDTDFLVFRPDISHSTVMRVGVNWRY